MVYNYANFINISYDNEFYTLIILQYVSIHLKLIFHIFHIFHQLLCEKSYVLLIIYNSSH